jgi:ribosomal-protein-alanine acetyltransferase
MPTTLRDGTPADLPALTEIETAVFSGDRLSRRSLARFLSGASPASLRVAVLDGAIAGYALVLRRSGSEVARLYSIAVAEAARGRGIGAALLTDVERLMRAKGASALRLEVRADNTAAIGLYERHGYTRFAIYRQYYEDGADAFRYQRQLEAPGPAGPGTAPDDSDEDRSPVLSTGPGRIAAPGGAPVMMSEA